MAECIFCGRSAGILRKKHKECEAKREAAWSRMVAMSKKAAAGSDPLDSLKSRLKEVALDGFIERPYMKLAMITGWEQAVDHFLEDGQLDEQEEKQLERFQDHFSFSQQDLDENGAYARLVKGTILREVMNGTVPDLLNVQGDLPFNFQKSETLIWLFQDVTYYEDKKKRHYTGGHHGVSFRIAKGVYYRAGAFRGHPVETTETVLVGTGLVAVTNRHLYFSSADKSFRIRHDKIVAIQPYDDGVAIQRDAQTAKPQLFVTGDGWFTYNLLKNVSTL